MALPRPLLSTVLVCASSLAVVAPAQAAGGTSSLKVLTEALTSTAAKQLDPKTSLVGSDLVTTVKNISALVAPQYDPACAAPLTSKPFARWRDNADYVPAPNGGFESGLDTWQAFGRVAITNENNSFFISGRATDAKSVTLGDGASIASASFCGGLAYPTVRMMTRSATGKPAKATVTIRYTGRDGLVGALPLGTVTAGAAWAPSEITLTASGLPLLTGTKLGVTITSTSGSIVIDDVYVDPYRRV